MKRFPVQYPSFSASYSRSCSALWVGSGLLSLSFALEFSIGEFEESPMLRSLTPWFLPPPPHPTLPCLKLTCHGKWPPVLLVGSVGSSLQGIGWRCLLKRAASSCRTFRKIFQWRSTSSRLCPSIYTPFLWLTCLNPKWWSQKCGGR